MNKCVLWIMFCIITGNCRAQTPRYSVIINEFLADPAPSVGLPNTEFIELKNTSNEVIQLEKWRIENGSTSAMISISYLLQPDSLVIICSKTQAIGFNLPEKTIGISSFPTLANESGMIILKDATGKTIHAVNYDQSWYRSPTKSEGGWSLELIDAKTPCDDKNWHASINNLGGTPGNENSIVNIKQPSRKIQATQCTAIEPTRLLLKLNQGVDSLSLSNTDKYTFSNINIHILSAKSLPPLFNTVELLLNDRMQEKNIYHLNVKEISHCKQAATDDLFVKTGLYSAVNKNDLVINEILFDPETGGSDFIELYNRTSSLINAKEIFLGSRIPNGSINKITQASKDNVNIFPGDHVVFTADTSYLKSKWGANESSLIELSNMPSLPDDKGNVVILNKHGEVIDELNYAKDMHFPLLRNISGVSLERVSTINSTSTADNWHSASSTDNYATPTRKNSQHIISENLDKEIVLFPEMISPNNDGIDDILNIAYNFQHQGTLISLFVFDYNGRLITKIADNQLCGTSGFITWNGLDRKNKKPPTGIYIIYAETFNLTGKKGRLKKVITIK